MNGATSGAAHCRQTSILPARLGSPLRPPGGHVVPQRASPAAVNVISPPTLPRTAGPRAPSRAGARLRRCFLQGCAPRPGNFRREPLPCPARRGGDVKRGEGGGKAGKRQPHSPPPAARRPFKPWARGRRQRSLREVTDPARPSPALPTPLAAGRPSLRPTQGFPRRGGPSPRQPQPRQPPFRAGSARGSGGGVGRRRCGARSPAMSPGEAASG